MALAKKCDRCGKYYDGNKKYDLHNYEKVDGIRFTSGVYQSRRMDICDDCLSGLRSYLNIKEGEVV